MPFKSKNLTDVHCKIVILIDWKPRKTSEYKEFRTGA